MMLMIAVALFFVLLDDKKRAKLVLSVAMIMLAIAACMSILAPSCIDGYVSVIGTDGFRQCVTGYNPSQLKGR